MLEDFLTDFTANLLAALAAPVLLAIFGYILSRRFRDWIKRRWQCVTAVVIMSGVTALVSWSLCCVPTLPCCVPTPTPTIYTLTPTPTQPPITCENYGIRITSHLDGAAVSGTFQISGSYENEPPGDSFFLINKSPDRSLYWPSTGAVKIDRTLKSWSGEVYINGEPPTMEVILVAIVGKSGHVLFEYYFKVGKITGMWEAIEILTDDVMVCAQITVEKTSP
ncbi:MAG: hypothetical protein JXB07_17165 [Anaerolineae bacterium]|nr:hypothetical protein [Anaerolineae bacterium]